MVTQMHNNTGISSLLERITNGTHTDNDLVTLRRAINNGKITIATGERAVAIGGDVNDTVIFTGGRNLILKGIDSNTLQEIFPFIQQPPFSVPFQVPPLPSYFVPRPEVSNELLAQFLADEDNKPGTLVISAVHGLGGIGKTTLVAALAHMLKVQERFPDGILWATLGQQPQILSRLHEWVQQLGDYKFTPTTIDGTSAHIHTLLHDKKCLLVIDDAWQADHVRCFLVGGYACKVVITTRDATIARKLGGKLYDLDIMTESQALTMFESRLGALKKEVREKALLLSRELGYLPLALELAAAQIENGIPWDDLLGSFRKGLADLASLELDEPTHRNESLRLSFRLSLDSLHPDEQEAFAWLGILPEDVFITPMMATTLWKLDSNSVRKRLYRFRNKALLKEVGEDQYTVHDLLHNEARLRLSEIYSLDVAHRIFLDSYKQKLRNGLWYTLPDDGYIHKYLTWHMEQAGRTEDIHLLLAEVTCLEKNGWFEAREALGQTTGYIDDINRALRLSIESYKNQFEKKAVGYQFRYALMLASVKSLIINIPATMLMTLVAKGVWTPEQGITYAKLIPDIEKRKKALSKLIHCMPDDLLNTLERMSIHKQKVRKNNTIFHEEISEHDVEYVEYSDKIFDKEYYIEEIIDSAINRDNISINGFGIQDLENVLDTLDEEEGSNLLLQLLDHVPYRLIKLAYQMTLEVYNDVERSEGMTKLIPYLRRPLKDKAIMEVLETIRSANHEEDKFEISSMIAPYLPDKYHVTIMELVDDIKNDYVRTKALCCLIPILSEAMQKRLIAKTLQGTYKLSSAIEKLDVLMGIIPYLTDEMFGNVLLEIKQLEKEHLFSEVLTKICDFAPVEFIEDIFSIAIGVEKDDVRIKILNGISYRLNKEQLNEALTIMRHIGDTTVQIQILRSLCLYLTQQGHIQDVFDEIKSVRELERREALLAFIIPHAAREGGIEGLLESAQQISKHEFRFRALMGIILFLESKKKLIEGLIIESKQLGDIHIQSQINILYALCITERGDFQDAYRIIQDIENAEERINGLSLLCPILAEHKKYDLMWFTLNEFSIEGVNTKKTLASAIKNIIPYVRDYEILEELKSFIKSINIHEIRDDLLVDYSRAVIKLDYMNDAYFVLVDLIAKRYNLKHIIDLIIRLAKSGYAFNFIEETQRIKNYLYRANLLLILDPYVPEVLIQEQYSNLIKCILEIQDSAKRAQLLAELLLLLPENFHSIIVEEAKDAINITMSRWPYRNNPTYDEFQDVYDFIIHDQNVGKMVIAMGRMNDFERAINTLHKIDSNDNWADTVIELAPYLPPNQFLGLLVEATRLYNQSDSWYDAESIFVVLLELLTVLPSELLQDALDNINTIQNTEQKIRLLIKVFSAMSTLQCESLFPIWVEIIHNLVFLTRDKFLISVDELVPAIYLLGEKDAANEIFHAIQDVGNWWP